MGWVELESLVERLAESIGDSFDVMLVKPPDPGELRETLERASRPARRRQASAAHGAGGSEGGPVESGEGTR